MGGGMRENGAMELPHTAGCLVCGRANVHGLQLSLHVHESDGEVWTQFVPRAEHIGFVGIVHGGMLATVLDEAMVWAATWHGKRFCVAGEMTVRFKNSAEVGKPVMVRARVESARSRLITAVGRIEAEDGRLIAEASGKYVPLDDERNRAFLATLVEEEGTKEAGGVLRRNA